MARPQWTVPAHQVLRVGPDFRLGDLDHRATPGWGAGRTAAKERMAAAGDELSDLQERLFAHGRTGGSRSVLLVLQGMDTSGKGGIVRHVIGMVDPQGVQHRSFGVPTDEEKAHDFLWRIRRALPRPGMIGVFDRSQYEDVLVPRVHETVPAEIWEERYERIVDFEREVVASGTTIVKVVLAISPEEQRERLAARLDRPDKHWKYDPGDLDERLLRPRYAEAYQAVLDRTSTDLAPWHAVPADRKWYARLAVSELLLHALEELRLEWPAANFDVEAEKARLAAQPW